jgi:hypothetical protein
MSLLRMALAAMRKTPASTSSSGAAAAQTSSVGQRGIQESIEGITKLDRGIIVPDIDTPPPLPSAAAASVRRSGVRDVGGFISPVEDVDKSGVGSLADILTMSKLTDPDKIRSKKEAAEAAKYLLTMKMGKAIESAEALGSLRDLPEYMRENSTGALDPMENAIGNLFLKLFGDPESTGEYGYPLAYRAELRNMSGEFKEGLGGLGSAWQGGGEYSSFGPVFEQAYRHYVKQNAVPGTKEEWNRIFSSNIDPNSMGDWDGYMIDQPELIKRMMYPLMKALDLFQVIGPNRIYPKRKVVMDEEGLPLPDISVKDMTQSERQAYNTMKYEAESGNEYLTLEGLSKDGENYISVDVAFPDFRPTWDEGKGAWNIGEDFGSKLSDEQLEKYIKWQEGDDVITVRNWEFNEETSVNVASRRDYWATEIDEEITSAVERFNKNEIIQESAETDILGAYDRMIEPDYFSDSFSVKLNYELDMMDLLGKSKIAGKTLDGDMKTLYFSDVYRVVEGGLKKSLRVDEIMGGNTAPGDMLNPKFLSADDVGKLSNVDVETAVNPMFTGQLDVMKDKPESSYFDLVETLGQQETSALFQRLGITGHRYLAEDLFMATQRRELDNIGINPWITNSKETLYYNDGDRLKYASPEVRALIADPVRSAPFRMAVLYNTNFRSELKRAIARKPAWAVDRAEKSLPAWKALSGESVEDKFWREGEELGYTDEWKAKADEWEEHQIDIEKANRKTEGMTGQDYHDWATEGMDDGDPGD